jgi:succinylarginine dihydrolase
VSAAKNEKLSMFDGPAIYRHRVVELARAREKLRAARDLTRQAATVLAELVDVHQLDLKTEIACTDEASAQLLHAETNVGFLIARTPIV